MPNARYAEIDTVQAVADVFVELTRNSHEVTLRFDGALIHYPVSVASVDRILGRCVLDITSIGDVDQMLALKRPFVLHARQHAAAMQSTPMQAREVLRRSSRLGLRCDLPEQLTLLKRRGYFRAALGGGMAVEVLLFGPGGQQWQAILCDLSIGGCLISLPLGEEEGLTVDQAGYRAQARFPSGETFEAASRLSHMYADPQAELFYVGVAFDIGLEREARAVWKYVREVEREVARQSPRPEMRPLAPSPLFTGDGEAPTS